MKSFKDQVESLRKSLFGEDQESTGKKLKSPQQGKKRKKTSSPSKHSSVQKSNRPPHYIQIGFDFGTAFSKCVYRDVNADQAWVYFPKYSSAEEHFFLYPDILKVESKFISCLKRSTRHYIDNGLFHLKWALKEAACGEYDSSILSAYKNIFGVHDNERIADIVEACAVYYLAGTFGDIRKVIRSQFRNFGQHPQDFMAINMGIPVAFTTDVNVQSLFQKTLCNSWGLSDDLLGHPPMKYDDVIALCNERQYYQNVEIHDACCIVPEVSANLQGFVKSRVSKPGLYLFSDTGAATVDQCVFTFTRENYEERLNYLHAEVLPLGSSQLEYFAASREIANHRPDGSALERWRTYKEQNAGSLELKYAKNKIYDLLSVETRKTLAFSKKKLYVKSQLENIEIIFSGGGHCEDPYKTAVYEPFSSPGVFSKRLNPDILGIPRPNDLNLDEIKCKYLISRLSVAYGLSFAKYDLVDNLFPDQLANPLPEEVWGPAVNERMAPSKEEC